MEKKMENLKKRKKKTKNNTERKKYLKHKKNI
jgi:hypothetical protein